MPYMKKKSHAKRRYKKTMSKKLSQGGVSVSLFIVLLMVLLIFLGSLFVTQKAPQTSSNTKTTQIKLDEKILNDAPVQLKQYSVTPYITSTGNENCKLITNDIVIVIDASGSMTGTKLTEAKAAANLFVQLLAINPENRIGLVTFNKTSVIKSQLTNDYASLKQQIDSIQNQSFTCIQCGALDGNSVIASSSRTNVKKSIVLLSDGKANHVRGVPSSTAKEEALAEMKKGFTSNSISYYTIAFGRDADVQFMRQAAVDTKGVQFTSSDEKQLKDSFSAAANAICTDQ